MAEARRGSLGLGPIGLASIAMLIAAIVGSAPASGSEFCHVR